MLDDFEGHKVVAAPRNIRKAIVYDGRHNIHVFAERGSRVDGKCCASLEAGQIFYAWKHSEVVDNNRVEIKVGKREVHNLLIYAAKLWTL